MENLNIFNPGSILINTSTNKLYGVLVSVLPNNKIIVFRLDKNTHPIFSKFEIHPHIAKVGVINEYQYSNIKSALLKHYRTYNLTPTEKKMLQPLMNFAFPLGIPEYQPDVELPERDIQLMDLNSKLTTGARIFLHTPPKSTYNYLDGKIVNVLERTPEGVWINSPSNEQDLTKLNNSLHFIFYKNANIPTFGGISRIVPITDENPDNKPTVSDILKEAFENMKAQDQLTTMMEFNGDKVRVMPKTMKIIFPEVYSGMTYNPNTDTFTADKNIITPALSQKLGSTLILGSRDNAGNMIEMNSADNELVFNSENSQALEDYQPEVKLSADGELIYEGGARKTQIAEFQEELDDIDKEEELFSRVSNSSSSKDDIRTTTRNIDDIVDNDIYDSVDSSRKLGRLTEDEKDFIELQQGYTKSAKHLSSLDDSAPNISETDVETDTENTDKGEETDKGDETDYDEGEIVEVVGEDEIGEVGFYEKVKLVEVDELEMIYKESIQKGDLTSYKIEKIPPLLRTDEVRNEILKQVNIISLLKHKLTGEDRNIIFKPQDYKPLISKYVKGDFTNKFIIPLVINKKKIYLDKSKQGQKEDYDKQSTEIIEDYYSNIANLGYLQDKKNVNVNNDEYVNNIIKELNPYMVNEDDNLGLLFRLGSEFENDDYNKLTQDTLTIKYCDKPMKCQSYSLNTMNFDYQVNLGPMGRFIADDEEDDVVRDIEEDEEKPDRDILYIHPRYKMVYQGDLIRIIGYVRPPLKYFNAVLENSQDTILLNLYETQKKNKEVFTINLEDINPEIIDEENEQFDITIHPDKFVIFLLPHDKYQLKIEEELNKIIPTIDDIIKLYLNKSPLNNTVENIYNILERFEYDTTELTQDIQRKIIEKNDVLKSLYEKYSEKLEGRFEDFQEKRKKEKRKEEEAKKNKTQTKSETKGKFKYITDDLLEDIGKFYYTPYENKGIPVDSDDMRLRWFMNSFDNGRYFFKTLFMHYLTIYQDNHKIENIETELAILKDKHVMMMNAPVIASTGTISGATECANKTTTPNVIKYPNLARLEKDNGKVAVDSDGNVIMVGDYALVDVEASKQLYKREIIGDVDMWIKEDMAVLYKLIQEKKNKCIANPEMKLEKANMCSFDMEAIKCEANDIFDMSKQKLDVEKTMGDLQNQIDYIKHLPGMIATLNKEIVDDRMNLINNMNSMKKYWKDIEAKEIKLEEHIKKTIINFKPCDHFKVIDYFDKIGKFDDDYYKLARSIFRNFLNVEPEFTHDYTHYDPTNNANNFSYCNICNQQLLCNHIRFGASYIEDDKPVNYDKIIEIFSEEVDGAYYCRACERYIANTEVLDIDDFGKGEDGFRIKTREITEETPLIEKQKQYLDNLINNLVDGEPTEENEDMQLKIAIFKLIKRLCGLDILSMNDEIEMINFLKSFQFTRKNDILQLLIMKYGAGNVGLLRKQMAQLYLIYLVCDITARYLIILQTTATPYEIRNKDCGNNIMGYPLISDMDAMDGVNFMLCLINQMSVLPSYSGLTGMKPSMFIGQLKKQVEDDNYVKTKIYNAVNNISVEIDYMYEFQQYKTNYWKTFLPRLEHIQIKWSPEKILNTSNLKEITSKNWHKMIEVGRENAVYYSLNIINDINRVIENADKEYNNRAIFGSCCGEEHKEGVYFDYMRYFHNKNSNIPKNLKEYDEINKLLEKIYGVARISISNILYEPLFKPSQTVFKFNLEVNVDEIKDIYLKYIDVGLNKGRIHIFDRYGRCILSNETKSDIMEKSYSQQDYKYIENAITSSNTINIKKYIDVVEKQTTVNIIDIEIEQLKKLVDNIPKLSIMGFLEDYFKKIIEAIPQIFALKGVHEMDGRNRKQVEQFNIHRHLSSLNAQIETEIDAIVQKIVSTDKQLDKYVRIMSNMGDYKQLYEEFKKNNNDDIVKADIFRYNKKEEAIQGFIKYLNDVINQIKNNKLSNPLNKEKIRPQYRDFLEFGDNVKLFKLLDKSTREIYDYARMFKSKQKFKVLMPEMVSSILHYLSVISLVNLFETLDNSNMKKDKSETVDYKFREPMPKDDALIDYSNQMDIGLITDDVVLDEDGEPMDLIESFEIKNSNNLKIISNFIITYLDKVNDTQSTYDDLTLEFINLKVTEDQQKAIEETLRSFEWLAIEKNEEIRQLTLLKMRMKKVDYKGLSEYLTREYGDEILTEENDEYTGEERDDAGMEGEEGVEGDGERMNNAYGMDKYELENELPQVFASEDMEGDMDYDLIGVGEDD